MAKRVDITGKRFGKLTVIKISRHKNMKDGKRILWLCECDCGNFSEVLTYSLKSGNTKSCGCKKYEGNRRSHGLSKSSEYHIWNDIKQRCHNSNNSAYYNYGSRGIRVCNRWLNSFEDFITDMGNRPSHKHTIDRIDNNGDYSPENCRWATRKEQSRNTGRTKIIEWKNEYHCLKDWSKIIGINYSTLQNRFKGGWSIEKAFTQPVQKH